ncbi:hypothetical protein KIL84_006005 [Mauremys mutica]|uniref:B-cell receptor CD22 first Ig-like domain-containing protein n=1 Tax=Mauremys mutica TaxID=74926 RepID=A0A9D4B4I4_9SAUR|nr:hypothetical protein KIL84_006005 [Mauremys mutica]
MDQIVYHSDEARVHGDFKGRVRYLGDLQHNCSLRVAGLRPSDQGTYRFRFEVVTNGSSRNASMSEPGQQLSVSGNQVPSSTPCSTQRPWITSERAPHTKPLRLTLQPA